MYRWTDICDFSRSVSRPSNTTQVFAPVRLTHACMATSSPCNRASSPSYSLRPSFVPDVAMTTSFGWCDWPVGGARRWLPARAERHARARRRAPPATGRADASPPHPLAHLDHQWQHQRLGDSGQPLATGESLGEQSTPQLRQLGGEHDLMSPNRAADSQTGPPRCLDPAPSVRSGMIQRVSGADSAPSKRLTGWAGTLSKVRRALSVVGELAISLGVVLALFVAYQLWWTNVSAGRLANEALAQVQASWTTSQADSPATHVPTPGGAFALAYIPRLRDSVWATPVLQGVSLQELARGLGHYPTTAMPGEVGNFALAGHRATNGEPLRDVDRLKVGDLVVVETSSHWFTYRLVRDQIVMPSDVWVLDPVPSDPGATPTRALITLTTCNPRWGSEQRWVWWGILVERTGKDGQPPAAVRNAG